MEGKWASGSQWLPWYVQDNGSGLRNERVLIDGQQRYLITTRPRRNATRPARRPTVSSRETSSLALPAPSGTATHRTPRPFRTADTNLDLRSGL